MMQVRPRNDPAQYDDLHAEWWNPVGAFAALHWLAEARARVVPRPTTPGALLVDVGCGGGVLAPRIAGYHHVGVDISTSALEVARGHGVLAVRASAEALPFRRGVAGVVVAGEILEHVRDVEAVVAELCRIAADGGAIVIDTLNSTARARFALVTIAERLPGGPPPRLHDPSLFVEAAKLQHQFQEHGFKLRLWGLRPSVRDYARFLLDRKRFVHMRRTRSVALVYQGVATRSR